MPSVKRTFSASSLSSVFSAISRPKGGKRLRKKISKVFTISKSKKVREVIVTQEQDDPSDISQCESQQSALVSVSSNHSLTELFSTTVHDVDGDVIVEAPIHVSTGLNGDKEPALLFHLWHEFAILLIQLVDYTSILYDCDQWLSWRNLKAFYLLIETLLLLGKKVGELSVVLKEEENRRAAGEWVKAKRDTICLVIVLALWSWLWASTILPFLTEP